MTAWILNFLLLLFMVYITPKMKNGPAKYFSDWLIGVLFLIFFIQVFRLSVGAGVGLMILVIVGALIGIKIGR